MIVDFKDIIVNEFYYNKKMKCKVIARDLNTVKIQDCVTDICMTLSIKEWNDKGFRSVKMEDIVPLNVQNINIKSYYSIMANLPIGSQISLTDGTMAVVKSKLGEGGQGVVYLVTTSTGTDMAFKCYIQIPEDAFFKNLEKLINMPAPSNSFLWPKAIGSYNNDRCGYIMNLRPNGYHDLSDFFSAGFDGKVKANFVSFSAKLQAAIQICNGFRKLHIQGLSYQDLNDGSFLINPGTGDVLICDNDNVCPNNTSITNILGKARYMAAEIMGDENGNRTMPNTNSDRLSLAIILYRLFMLDHPFEGESIIKIPCLTEEIERRKYGREAVFVYDATDASNRPNTKIHRNSVLFWSYCPDSLKRMFQKALSHEAIIDPYNRVSDKDWKELFVELRRKLIVCPKSPKDKDHDFMTDNIVNKCIRCNDPIVVNTILHFSDNTDYVVSGHKLIYIGDEMTPVARGVMRPNDDGTYEQGVRNISNTTWNIQTPSGKLMQIEPGRNMPLRNGMQIRFRGDSACKVVVK